LMCWARAMRDVFSMRPFCTKLRWMQIVVYTDKEER
jgi:hypothetical protein